ncbi:polysaccharide biosynthesis tyrosine autokinase [Novosphingobium sp. 1949]|uniref:non-specific protein-tyrosine kinase n=1 Tax=Novosphingobium organovorum TaxID=2930092 RepID=A0ABT0BAN7_9SPHN|nr:polysaccharide biosynthesis tyrosine autokinase [Novosphingobium organovorum]MCJ2181908.1 polysaccharide biosynthesis tyrosine autokinase [Novosphingobium organovorum]
MIDKNLSSQAQDVHIEGDDFEIDISSIIRKVVGSVRQNLILIACIVFAVLALGTLVTMLMTPKYEAMSRILIEDQADQIIEGGDLQEAVTANGTDRFLQTQLGIIESRALAGLVVDGAKLDSDTAFFENFGSEMPTEAGGHGESLAALRREKAVDVLLSGLAVSIPLDSRIATITITSHDPQLSAKLANDYADKFVQYNLNQKYDSSSYARRFLADQLDEAREKLTQSERELNGYARAAGLIRIGDDSDNSSQNTVLSVTNSQLMQINDAAAKATADRIAAEDRWKAIANKQPLEISEVNSNGAVTALVASRAHAQSELAEELSNHLEGYATVKAKRAEVAEYDKRIQAIANSVKNAALTDYQAALKRENSLNGEVASLRDAALREQDRGVQYSVLKRVSDTNRALYESLLSRYNQLNASAGASANNITVVDRAVMPTKPTSPNLLLNLALAFVLSLMLAAAVVTLKELLDDAIHSPDDVEKKLGLPLLGLVPLQKQDEVEQGLKDRRSNVSEAYRSLVTNLSYSSATGLPKVVVVTSSREGEGKSTTARAIAADIASLGKRTLLVDADLRRPTLHRAMGDTSGSGLTEFLVGEKSFEEIVRQAPDGDLFSYVTALPMPPDPSLILAGHGTRQFIEHARGQFDVVILDCPPLLGLSDVPLIAQHADGVLFVIDASSFHRGAVKSALRRLAMVDAKLLGVVLNRFAPRSGTDDYAYYAYNYYSYGNEQD